MVIVEAGDASGRAAGAHERRARARGIATAVERAIAALPGARAALAGAALRIGAARRLRGAGAAGAIAEQAVVVAAVADPFEADAQPVGAVDTAPAAAAWLLEGARASSCISNCVGALLSQGGRQNRDAPSDR